MKRYTIVVFPNTKDPHILKIRGVQQFFETYEEAKEVLDKTVKGWHEINDKTWPDLEIKKLKKEI